MTVETPKRAALRRPPEILTPDEISRLLEACSRFGPAGIRNRALIVVLWRGGLRVSEALALRPCDCNMAGELHVLHGKGDRARVVGIDPLACAVVERWLARRARLLEGPGAALPLFCTISAPVPGGPLSPSYVREALHAAARRAGIAHRVHPHGLRHTHAAELARAGVPPHVIRRQLGHSSLQTTARYIEHLAPGEVTATMRARDWPF